MVCSIKWIFPCLWACSKHQLNTIRSKSIYIHVIRIYSKTKLRLHTTPSSMDGAGELALMRLHKMIPTTFIDSAHICLSWRRKERRLKIDFPLLCAILTRHVACSVEWSWQIFLLLYVGISKPLLQSRSSSICISLRIWLCAHLLIHTQATQNTIDSIANKFIGFCTLWLCVCERVRHTTDTYPFVYFWLNPSIRYNFDPRSIFPLIFGGGFFFSICFPIDTVSMWKHGSSNSIRLIAISSFCIWPEVALFPVSSPEWLGYLGSLIKYEIWSTALKLSFEYMVWSNGCLCVHLNRSDVEECIWHMVE